VDVQRGVQSVFRAANERLRSRLRAEARIRPVICECSDTNCMTVLDVPFDDYARIRDDGHFILVPGHVEHEIETVVARRETYVVASKD